MAASAFFAVFVLAAARAASIDDAMWVVPPNGDSAGGSILRLVVQLPEGRNVSSAVVSVAGLGHAELRLNGDKVSSREVDPAWSNYNATCYFVVHDIDGSMFVSGGANVFGALLGNGMYWVPNVPGRYTKFVTATPFGPRALRFAAVFSFSDGGDDVVLLSGVNATWVADPSGGPMTASLTYGGEDFDARLWHDGWDEPGPFDASGWLPAKEWDGPSCTMQEQSLLPLIVQETLPTVSTHSSPGGVVYDLGKNFAGWPAVTVFGDAGASVRLVCGELMQTDGTPIQDGSPQYFTYTLKGSPNASAAEYWEPRFSFYGFRWCQTQLSGTVTVVNVTGRFVYSNSTTVGSFNSSSPMFRDIHRIVLESYRSNFGHVWMDCPHREKLGWLEAVHLLAPGIMFNYDVHAMFLKVVQDAREAQLVSGLVPDIAPEYTVFAGGFRDSPEWGSAFLFLTDYLWTQYGDSSAIAAHFDAMAAYAQYLLTKAVNKPFILDYGLGDWCDDNTKVSGDCGPGGQLTVLGVTGTAILYGDATLLAKFAGLLGRDNDVVYWSAVAANVSTAFHAAFFNETTGSYGSQTANGMALALGVAPDSARAAALAALVADIKARGNVQTGGDIGHKWILNALSDGNETSVLYAIHTSTAYPSYGYILGLGATSLPEQWDGGGSQLHSMLGHVEEWFYGSHVGITCGARACSVAPKPHARHSDVCSADGDAWAEATHSGRCYRLAVSWRLSCAGDVVINVTVSRVTTSNPLPDCPPITVRAPGEVSFSRLEQPSPLWILNESTDPSSFVLSGPPPRTHAHTDTRDGSVAVSDDDATPATLILRSGCDGCVIAS